MKFFPLIWSSLWRKPTPTLFTLLSITAAFVLFGLLQGVNAWLNGLSAGSQGNRLYVVSRVSQIQLLPSAYQQRIEHVSGVKRVTYVGGFPAIYREPGNNVVVFATEPQGFFDLYPDWQVAPAQLQSLIRNRTGALVGARLMNEFGWKVGDRIPLRSAVIQQDGSMDWTFEIVGTYEVPQTPAQANRILVNYAYFDAARVFERGRVFAFVVGIDDPAHAPAISAAVDALFANSADETVTQDEKTYVQGQLRQIGDIGLMLNAIVGAVLFTLLFLTGNTMMQSVRARIPELAILKTVGFSDEAVTALVLIESLLLCVLAALLGLGGAALIFPVTAALGLAGTALPLNVVAWGVGIAVLLALASGVPPARRAHRLAIVDAIAGR